MALPIIEQPLYGEMLIETSPWATPFVWTDRTASLVAGFNYSQGGRNFAPGSSQVDVGTLNATFKNLASFPAVGALVRISFSSFAGYAFVGYVQDVSQRVVFDQSVSLTTPITLTTLHCVDWVGYVSQFQLVGVGGANFTTGIDITTGNYDWDQRSAAINKVVDPTYATKIISKSGTVPYGTPTMGDTDLVANISNHLDLISNTCLTYWYPRNVIPTNTTTGRTGLVEVSSGSTFVSSGKTFTDLAGTAGQLHYTEIDIENSSQNVANTIILNNKARVILASSISPEITKIGGYNENNYVVVNNTNVSGIAPETVQKASDSASIVSYGNRQTEIDTNVNVFSNQANLCINPSVEYSDDGWGGIAATRARRRRPSEESTPFAAANGDWAMRSYQSSAATTAQFRFSGGESDGIPIRTGTGYVFQCKVARGTPSRTDARFQLQIDWQNDDEATISSTTGALVNLTTAQTWYQGTVSGNPPAGATRAVIRVIIGRSGGGNQSVGDKYWADEFIFSGNNYSSGYFDGDTPFTSTYGYIWSGGVGSSPSLRFDNYVENLATLTLSKYSTTSLRVSRIRWNAQEDLASIPALSVGKTISLVYKGTTTTYRIVGIDGNVDPERYMIDYYLVKV
jgi:hypothetical protein